MIGRVGGAGEVARGRWRGRGCGGGVWGAPRGRNGENVFSELCARRRASGRPAAAPPRVRDSRGRSRAAQAAG